MQATTRISPEQYESMAFDGVDRELVDGELVERGMPDYSHSRVQARFTTRFGKLEDELPLHVCPELRLRLPNGDYLIPDVSVLEREPANGRYPTSPPPAVLEIVFRDDRWLDLLDKLRRLKAWGVPHVWVAEPDSHTLHVFEAAGLLAVSAFELPAFGLRIRAEELFKDLPTSSLRR